MTLVVVGLLLAVSPDTPNSVEAVLECSGQPERCQASDWELARAIVKLEGRDTLVRRYAHAAEPQRRVLVFALCLLEPNAQVLTLLWREAESADLERRYYALHYLAKRCDGGALGRLSVQPMVIRAPCGQWAATVELFGRCRYERGVPFLVASLDHACLNVVVAARDSLHAIYPDSPRTFQSHEDERQYFIRRGVRR